MQSVPKINMDELWLTFEWVSAADALDNQAYVRREDGKIFWNDDASDQELPEDVEDESRYVLVPHSRELDLGSKLPIKFARRYLSMDAYDATIDIFRRRGAYQRFKQLLDQNGKLQEWYQYQERAKQDALREWCEDNALMPPTERVDDADED